MAGAVDEDLAVDGFHVLADDDVLAGADAAVDGLQATGLRAVGDMDAAVDGADIAGARVGFDVDAAVDGLQVAVGLAGLGGDAAVDLVDILSNSGLPSGEGDRHGQDKRKCGNKWDTGHGMTSKAMGTG